MEQPLRIALLGFGDFERRALGTALGQTPGRQPLSYALADSPGQAELLIVDADCPDAVRQYRALDYRPVLFVGATPPPGAAAWTLRPVNPLHILRELDALVQMHEPDGYASFKPRHLFRELELVPPAPRTPPQQRLQRREALPGRLRPIPPHPAAEPRRALVVDPHTASRLALERLLRGLDWQVTGCTGEDEALDLLARVRYAAVLLDGEARGAGGLDALRLCQRIRRSTTLPEGLRPPLLLVARDDSPSDRARAMLAGFDAQLGKPVEPDHLRQRLDLLIQGCRARVKL
ncbi:response regulator [Amphibiibacter pelophylacis]|uniref:Response regulator n=1 Tax=Amphibiibacter pelophylacis TaxID=1799477 RepID=A0ACC6P383_9BURK